MSVMSAAVFKRKMLPPLSLADPTDHFSEPKRPRSGGGEDDVRTRAGISNEARGRAGLSEEVRERVLCILTTLMQHIFALPFVKIETDLVNNNSNNNNNNKLYLDDVYNNVKANIYGSIQEIMDALCQVLDVKQEEDGELEFGGKKLLYKSSDVEVMAKCLKKEIEILHDQEFSLPPPRRQLALNSLSEFIGNDQNDEVIFSKLKSRYQHVPDVVLLAKALEMSFGYNVDVKSIEEELEKRESEAKPKYQLYKFFPCRNHDFDIDKVHHSYIAGYQFHKMITKATSAPIAMRTILNISDSIESITYIENDESTKKYEEQKELFLKDGKVNDKGRVDEMLLFHGTSVASLENIMASNFLVDSVPIQVNTLNETRKKTMMFGRGVYFSEIPAISLMYGNGLLLCKVMLGDCEQYKPQGSAPDDIPAEFDSREIKSHEDEGVIHVVKRPTQILPYCVIKLKAQSLTSQFSKPGQPRGQTVQGSCPTHGLSCINCTSFVKASPSPQGISWTQVDTKKQFDLGGQSRREVAEDTVRLYSRPYLSDDKEEEEDSDEETEDTEEEEEETEETEDSICSICCDSLGTEDVLSLSLCGHRFHKACLTGLVEHQAGHQHIQCPNCQTLHGVRTGNMPTTGSMMYTRHSASLPGYPDHGMIIIKYHFNNGVQDKTHPAPGKPFYAKGFPRTAFLPANGKGERVLQMLIKAFQRRLTFTIGRSISRGEDDCVTWNGIHHKTVIKDNGSGHGYPDMDYLDRVIQELKLFGITD